MQPDETPVEHEHAPVLEPVEPVSATFDSAVTPARRPQREPFWGYEDLAIVVGLMFAAMAVVVLGAGAAVFLWPHLKQDPMPLLLPSNLAMYLLLLLIFKLVFNSRYAKPVLPSLGWRMTDSAVLGYAALGGLALPFVISGIGYLLHTPKVSTPMDQIPDSIPLALMAVLLAPFFEELFFRGFLQPLFVRTFGLVFGVLVTAILFGGLHAAEYSFVWQYVVAVGLVGVALGAVRAWTNSIVPTTVMHGCFNGLQVIAVAFSRHHK
jgi:membrane protease YdiL (CAAX protease family)